MYKDSVCHGKPYHNWRLGLKLGVQDGCRALLNGKGNFSDFDIVWVYQTIESDWKWLTTQTKAQNYTTITDYSWIQTPYLYQFTSIKYIASVHIQTYAKRCLDKWSSLHLFMESYWSNKTLCLKSSVILIRVKNWGATVQVSSYILHQLSLVYI